MKSLRLIPIVLSAFLISAAPAPAPNSSSPIHLAKITSIDFRVQETPRFQVEDVRNKRVRARAWLELAAEIEGETTSENESIPELAATWHAIVKDKFSKPKANRPDRRTGSVTFQNVPTHKNKILVSAYIHPDTLQALTGKERPTESDIEVVAIEVSGRDFSQTKERKKGMAKKEDKSRWWEKWQDKPLDHTVVPKSRTPFAPLWTDLYPQERPE